MESSLRKEVVASTWILGSLDLTPSTIWGRLSSCVHGEERGSARGKGASRRRFPRAVGKGGGKIWTEAHLGDVVCGGGRGRIALSCGTIPVSSPKRRLKVSDAAAAGRGVGRTTHGGGEKDGGK